MKKIAFLFFTLYTLNVFAQLEERANLLLSTKAQLPPLSAWKGNSESLLAKENNPWITFAEKSNFVLTPTYAETMDWLKKLSDASPLLTMVSIGKSVEGRDIFMVIASTEKNTSPTSLKASIKPLLLVQAGIHAGEIDGKDAGMMLLRDIAFGTKSSLLDKVNFLFIPILNVDGHERTSAYNRPNQRGPENMGYRTNAQNLNLNRDYAKLDTKEISAVVKTINSYNPILYIDIHVTDGADYQYDITFGGAGKQGYSPAITSWFESSYSPVVDKALKEAGHIPGPFINGKNWNDLSDGIVDMMGGPNYSSNYGDLRHLATLLVENHSLKPYKQRVLGTYVLLESTLKILTQSGAQLKESTHNDQSIRARQIPVKWRIPKQNIEAQSDTSNNRNKTEAKLQAADSLQLLGISFQQKKSELTNSNYIEWTGEKVTSKIAVYRTTEVADWIKCPKGYWVPAACDAVIERLKLHGIKMEILQAPREVNVEMYRIKAAKIENAEEQPLGFEGRNQVKGKAVIESRKQLFSAGSAYVSTDQSLGELAMVLLEPNSPNSFFSWGFFLSIFQRTEYIEAYVMEPLIKKMLAESPALKKEFEEKKLQETAFANNPTAIYEWFYSKTKYYDEKYLLYPVAREF